MMRAENTQKKADRIKLVSELSQSQKALPALSAKSVELAGYDDKKIMMLCQRMAQILGLSQFLPNEEVGQQALLDYINVVEAAIDQQALLQPVSESRDIHLESVFENDVQKDFNSGSAFENLKSTRIEPHLQLFLSFLSLLKHPQQQLNDVTQRHMDFYYQQVLQFKVRSAKGQRVFVCFELSDGVQEYQLAKGTRLLAQPQVLPDGVKSLLPNVLQPQYSLDSQIKINLAKVTQVRTILANENQVKKRFDVDDKNEFTPFTLLDSHQGVEIDSQEKSPATENAYNLNTLFLSSSTLSCQQGKRIFTFGSFKVSSLAYYKLFISTTNGWTEISEGKYDNKPSYSLGNSTLTITLPPNVPAVVPPGDSVKSSYPVIQFVPTEGAPALKLDDVKLSVEVNGVTDISFTNDEGEFNNDANFNLFGTEPSVGASLYLSCQDIANKPITSLTLNMNWMPGALPNTSTEAADGSGIPDIDGIYNNYYIPDGTDTETVGEKYTDTPYKDEFCIDLQSVNGVREEYYSTQEVVADSTLSNSLFQQTIKWTGIENQDVTFGKLKLSLTKGDFLYHQYFLSQNIQAQKIAEQNINIILSSKGNSGAKKFGPIYPPYTPATRPISLDYTVGVGDVKLQYLNEFGQLNDSAVSLEGNKSNADVNSILFKVSPLFQGQSVNILLGIKSQNNQPVKYRVETSLMKVTWHYWLPEAQTNNAEVFEETCGEWRTLKCNPQWNEHYDYCLLTFNKPAALSQDDVWIKVSLPNAYLSSNANLIYLHTQAALASEVIDESNYFPVPLAKNQISSLVQSNNKISTVSQPLASFGGATKQTDWQLSKAASNRLKNRARAITPNDYESLVLNQFPQIERVECQRANKDTAGGVTILITPKISVYSESNYPLGGVQLLFSVQNYLESCCSPAVKLTVDFKGRSHE